MTSFAVAVLYLTYLDQPCAFSNKSRVDLEALIVAMKVAAAVSNINDRCHWYWQLL